MIMKILRALYGVFCVVRDVSFALGLIVLVAFGYLFVDELGKLPIDMPEAARAYPETAAPVKIPFKLDPAESTALAGLTDAQRTERMLRSTIMVVTGERALGSGVIIDNKACYAVTNEHVIGIPGDIKVSYITRFREDGSAITKTVDAEIMGIPSKDNDLALLKLSGCEGTFWAPIGDSDVLRHGDLVTAIGHPKGQFWTLTEGVVSQPRRKMEGYTDSSGWEMIQVDAAINSGNSGGPLFTRGGALIGINSMKRTDGENLGYARPANLVETYLVYLSHYGAMPKILLGVEVSQMDDEMAATNGVPASYIKAGDFGLLIKTVMPDGKAASIGLKADDVLLAVNGDGVYDVHQFKRLLYRHTPHGAMKLTIIRDGQLQTVTVSGN